MSAVFWESKASEVLQKHYILSRNNISCFIWTVMGYALFFFLLFKASAFIYHHPGTYMDSQWTENKAWICWKNHLACVVLPNITPWSKCSVFYKSYPKQILDEEYTEAFRFLTMPFQRYAILNVASCDAVWTEHFAFNFFFLAFVPFCRDNCVHSLKKK